MVVHQDSVGLGCSHQYEGSGRLFGPWNWSSLNVLSLSLMRKMLRGGFLCEFAYLPLQALKFARYLLMIETSLLSF